MLKNETLKRTFPFGTRTEEIKIKSHRKTWGRVIIFRPHIFCRTRERIKNPPRIKRFFIKNTETEAEKIIARKIIPEGESRPLFSQMWLSFSGSYSDSLLSESPVCEDSSVRYSARKAVTRPLMVLKIKIGPRSFQVPWPR